MVLWNKILGQQLNHSKAKNRDFQTISSPPGHRLMTEELISQFLWGNKRLHPHYIFCRRWVGIFFCPFPKRRQKFQKGSQDEVWVPRGSIYWFYGGQWRIELVLERWRLVHYTKVLVAQGCAPPNSAWHQVWVNEGSIHWFHCGRSWSELVLEKWRLVRYTKVLQARLQNMAVWFIGLIWSKKWHFLTPKFIGNN